MQAVNTAEPLHEGAQNDTITDTRRFLDAWFLACPEGELLEVRPLQRRGRNAVKREWFDNAEEAAAYVAASVAHGDDVYIGALPRTGRGGAIEDVGARAWLWADLDYGTDGHKKAANHPTREAALAALRGAGIEPTLVVATGGGIHAWWCLTEPAAPAEWDRAIRRLNAAIGGDPNTLDCARILRVPGTPNRKLDHDRPVELIAASGRLVPLRAVLSLPPGPDEDLDPGPVRPQGTGARGPMPKPFERAKDIPVADVLAWLGVELHEEGRRVYCACPVHSGSNAQQMVVGGKRNLATCFGDCGKPYTSVDLVIGAKGVEPKAAVNLLAERFGFEGFPPEGRAKRPSTSVTRPAVSGGGGGGWKDLMVCAAGGTYKSTAGNLNLIIDNDPAYGARLRFNTMTLRVELDGVPLDDGGYLGLCHPIERDYPGMTPSAKQIGEACTRAAKRSPFSPVRDYLQSLEWDGVSRIERLVPEVLGAEDNDLNRKMMRTWFISACARGCEPGCKVDSVLVLVGPQGYRKSTFFRALGEPWFADTPLDLGSKDAYLAIASAWIYEVPEVESMICRSHAGAVKAFLTSQSDKFRIPYEAGVSEIKRGCVIAGTTNETRFLEDPSGSRRFHVMTVTKRIDVARIKADRDQLFAEAMVAYRAGEKWWLDEADEGAREERSDAYQASDPWEEAIARYVAGKHDQSGMTLAAIMGSIPGMELAHQDKRSSMRVSQILKRLGYESVRSTTLINGVRPRVWVKPGAAG